MARVWKLRLCRVRGAGIVRSPDHLYQRGFLRSGHLSLTDMAIPPSNISVPDNQQIVVFDGAYGTWERLALPELKRTGGSTVGFGTHNYGSALSADGIYLTYTNADTWLPLWSTTGLPNLDKPSLVAETQGGIPSALALSADGSRAAQAVNTIYVSRSTLPGQKRAAPTALTGRGRSPGQPGQAAFAKEARPRATQHRPMPGRAPPTSLCRTEPDGTVRRRPGPGSRCLPQPSRATIRYTLPPAGGPALGQAAPQAARP